MANPRKLHTSELLSHLMSPYKAAVLEVRRARAQARAGGHLVGLGRRTIPVPRPPRRETRAQRERGIFRCHRRVGSFLGYRAIGVGVTSEKITSFLCGAVA